MESSSEASLKKHYYIAFTSNIPPLLHRKLESLGCTMISKAFWSIPKSSLKQVLLTVEGLEYFLFKRSRDIKQWKIAEDPSETSVGSLVIIVYKGLQNSAKARKAVSRALRKSPCIKISNNVYAFPQVRDSKYLEFQGKVVSPTELSRLVRLMGGRALCFPKLVAKSYRTEAEVVKRLRQRLIEESSEVTLKAKRLSSKLSCEPQYDLEKMKTEMKEIEARARSLVYLIKFLHKTVKLDLRTEAVKCLKAVSAAKSRYKKLKMNKQREISLHQA